MCTNVHLTFSINHLANWKCHQKGDHTDGHYSTLPLFPEQLTRPFEVLVSLAFITHPKSYSITRNVLRSDSTYTVNLFTFLSKFVLLLEQCRPAVTFWSFGAPVTCSSSSGWPAPPSSGRPSSCWLLVADSGPGQMSGPAAVGLGYDSDSLVLVDCRPLAAAWVAVGVSLAEGGG